MNIFFDINADGTVVMLITHDAKVSAQTECIMFMSDGKIVNEMRLPKFLKKINSIEPRKKSGIYGLSLK